MDELDPNQVSAGAPQAHLGDALTALSQERQRPRRAEELDVATAIAGLWATGRSAGGPADQRALQESLGATAQLFPAFDEAAKQMAGGQSLGPSARPAPNSLPAFAGQRSNQHSNQAGV